MVIAGPPVTEGGIAYLGRDRDRRGSQKGCPDDERGGEGDECGEHDRLLAGLARMGRHGLVTVHFAGVTGEWGRRGDQAACSPQERFNEEIIRVQSYFSGGTDLGTTVIGHGSMLLPNAHPLPTSLSPQLSINSTKVRGQSDFRVILTSRK